MVMPNSSSKLESPFLFPTPQFLVFFSFLTICSTVSIPNFDLTSVTFDPTKTGFTLFGNAGSDWFGFSIKTAGDINKDGYADFLIGAPQKFSNQGMVYVIYGDPTNSLGNIDFSTTGSLNPGSTGFTIKGNAPGDQLGISVSTAGDINKDGCDDFIIGAPGKSTAYVIYGKESYTTNIDLSSTQLDPATTGFKIKGVDAASQFGYSVSTAGDINKDGYADMVIGSHMQFSERGSVYVIYGKPSYSSNFDLSATSLIPSSTGFTITGNFAGDHFGFSLSTAGDVNKDTYDDIVIGSDNKDTARGYVYVVYGKANPVDIDLSGSTVLDPATTGFLISGENLYHHFGFSVSKAGDVNKDGYADILVGGWGVDSAAGGAYVIYGGPTLTNLVLGTAPLDPASTGFKISGSAVGDHLGSAVSTAGDMNGDGYSDVLVGADWFNFQQGAAYVIYGKAAPANVVLGTTPLDPDTTGFTIKGASVNNNLGFGVGFAGDINQDGYSDILVGAYKKNSEAGAVYVIHAGCMTANCVSCVNKVCQTCDPGLPYYLDLSFSCVTSCPVRTFTSSGKCQACPSNCDTCTSGTVCTVCSSTYFLSGSSCTQNCPVKTYASTTTKKCEACLTNCDVCSDSSTCTTCTSPNLLYQSTSCGANCPATTYDNSAGACAGCPSNCDTCTSSSVCTVCSSTYFLSGSSCTQNCPVKTYGSTSTKKCESCPANCDTCTSSSVCTVCSSTYFLSGSSCTQSCPIKTFASATTQKCESCPTDCDVCSDSNTCTTCTSPKLLYQAGCLTNCPIKTFDNSNGACSACSSNCDICTSSTVCTVCSSSYFLSGSSCTQTCPIKTYASASTKKCEACPNNCDVCTDSNTCTSCTSSFFLSGSSCTQNCPTRTYASTITGKCESCSANCLTCTSSTSCQSCDQKYAVVNDQCEACPVNCDACTSSIACSTCTAPYFLSLSWCLPSCPNATYPSNGKCEGCPAHCAVCTSINACQTCDQDYVLANVSSCVIPPTPTYPKTESAATKAITSSVTSVGSAVCVGSATFSQTTIVSKIVQNMRYLNLTVTDDLSEVYQTWSTNLISWDFPDFLSGLNHFRQAPYLFSQFNLGSPFLTNFWSTLMTLTVGLGAFIGCFLLRKLVDQTKYNKSWPYRILLKLVLGSFNFALVQVYGCLDDIVFYLVLDIRGNPLDSVYSWASVFCGTVFLAVGGFLVYLNFRTARNYQKVKLENQGNLEEFNERNKYWELFYADFDDTDMWSQCTLALMVIRSGISSFIITVLYNFPLMQTLFLLVEDGAMILFLIKKNPFTTLRGKLTQYYFETITLLVHLAAFVLSFQGDQREFSEDLLRTLCTSIIYLNMGLMIGSVGFMFIELYKRISGKVKAKAKAKVQEKEKTQKYQTIAIQTDLDDESLKTSMGGENSEIKKPKKLWIEESKQMTPKENSIDPEDNTSFTHMNLWFTNGSNLSMIAEDSDIDKIAELFPQRGQSRFPITDRNRRKNIKKKQPQAHLKERTHNL